MSADRERKFTVTSPRGGSVKQRCEWVRVEHFKVWEAANEAAVKLGYSPQGSYTLATEDGVLLDPLAAAPTKGTFDLVDGGEAV